MRRFAIMMGFLTLWAAGSAHAAEVGVFPVVGTNLSDGESAAIGQLIASAYALQSHAPVFSPQDLAASFARTQSERDSARELGLQAFIHIEAIRLTTRISLYARLANIHGSTLYEVRDTAVSLDDMDVVSERIAATLYRRTPIEYTRTIDNVTGREARKTNRLFVEKIFGARFGVLMPFAKHLENQASLLAQFDARLEQRDYFLEMALGFWLPSRTNSREGLGGLVMQLGGSYYLTHTSVSPYLGIGVSPRYFTGEYEGAGLSVNGHVGVMFLREASTRLYAELRLDQNLIKVRHSADQYYVGTPATAASVPATDMLPTELTLAIGVGF
jgi:hypothetical protein